jgi:hypothetical protein
VKTILATALILALGITGISLWGAVHARRMAVSSSQIFVHGTPVCVLQRGGSFYPRAAFRASPGAPTCRFQPDIRRGTQDPHLMGIIV